MPSFTKNRGVKHVNEPNDRVARQDIASPPGIMIHPVNYKWHPYPRQPLRKIDYKNIGS